ncbi:SPOR domain-containing protein [Simiduia agarivorans]|uniref:Sporulation family protein n=1 Tax=Simiduia agarivorans (strain DSM 21679 / JCM 13881 / BCRC 17597 / SA1) TaxID=1117647 RepID=K4L1M0_SIMAS|nr:SPOR domain-containing protein [Simiduia agarivorans]AFV00073.1 sporulation family protein [Simiduia agarivorans SA1 = DSM 21679]
MTQDFANRKRRKQPSKKKSDVPGWVWLFTGAVLGAFVMFLVYLSDQPPAKQVAVAEAPKAETKAPEKTVPKPRFDFYKLLEESEVVVETPEETRKQLAEQKTEQVEYLLQVGSFKKAEDADSVRAKLILLNMDAKVEKVTVKSGETWHRVIVGPFDNTSAMANARSTLVSNRFDTLLLKRKPG